MHWPWGQKVKGQILSLTTDLDYILFSTFVICISLPWGQKWKETVTVLSSGNYFQLQSKNGNHTTAVETRTSCS